MKAKHKHSSSTLFCALRSHLLALSTAPSSSWPKLLLSAWLALSSCLSWCTTA